MPVSFIFLFLPSSISVTSYFPLIYLSWRSLSRPTSPRGRWNERGVLLLSQYFSFTWKPEIGCLRDEIIPVAVLTLKSSRPRFTISHWLRFRRFTLLRLKVFWLHQLVFVLSWISRFPPPLALSKKNTLDEFQAKVWQLFHCKPRLWEEKNIEITHNNSSVNLIQITEHVIKSCNDVCCSYWFPVWLLTGATLLEEFPHLKASTVVILLQI